MTKKDITGQRFGRLSVLAEAKKRGMVLYWLCKCDCGNEKEIRGTHLLFGAIQSCGCLHKERFHAATRKHGRSKTSTYVIWLSMHQRCRDKHSLSFANYGGRGIRVCERWRSFENFLADMGERPTDRLLERVNNDGNYEPSNCIWASKVDQANNTRKNVFIEHDGKRLTYAQWSRVTGVSASRIRDRITRLGWDVERALVA